MGNWSTSRMTQGFGPTDEQLDGAYQGYPHFNKGNDYSLATGTPIDSNVQGEVVFVTNNADHSSGWGRQVHIRDAQGFVHQYGHLDSTSVKVGDTISAGQIVGASGNTGSRNGKPTSSGPHLSYDVKDQEGNYIDPTRFVGGDNMTSSEVGNSLDPTGARGMSPGERPQGNWSDEAQADYERRQKLVEQADEVMQRWVDGNWESLTGEEGKIYEALESEIADIDLKWLNLDDRSNRDEADRFTQLVKLGDIQQDQANTAFDRWLNKKDMAVSNAQSQISDAKNRNIQNAELEAARFENYGRGPVGSDTTFHAPKYEDALAKWEKQGGVEPEPSANLQDYPGYGMSVPNRRYTDIAGGPPGGGAGPGGGGPTTGGGSMGMGAARANESMDYPSDRPPRAYGLPDAGFSNRPTTTDKIVDTAKDLAPYAGAAAAFPLTAGPAAAAGAAWKYRDELGGAAGAIGGAAESIMERLKRLRGGKAAGQTGTSGSKFWQNINRWQDWIPGAAGGMPDAPGGPVRVGEKGPETMIHPDGTPSRVGEMGQSIMDVPKGSMIVPNDVPPEEAFMFAELIKAMEKEDPSTSEQAQQARANDPDLQSKVKEAVLKAIAAEDAANPPKVPTLVGQWDKDPWEATRQLSAPPPQEVQQ